MATVTFSLIALKKSHEPSPFIQAVKDLPESEKALWLGRCHHWIHEPELSVEALLGNGSQIHNWDYLLISKGSEQQKLQSPNHSVGLPPTLDSFIDRAWSVCTSTPSDPAVIPPSSAQVPKLPPGWSPTDPSALEAATPPPNLSASLALLSRPFNSSTKTTLKSFMKAFGTSHTGPVAMFNLLAYVPPNGREQYIQYVAAFQESVGKDFGGQPIVLGFGVQNGGDWEDAALIGYPSLWHFAAMLDSGAYADADRRFKIGAVRDNPLMCCTEVEI